jgi:hypothetical protein
MVFEPPFALGVLMCMCVYVCRCTYMVKTMREDIWGLWRWWWILIKMHWSLGAQAPSTCIEKALSILCKPSKPCQSGRFSQCSGREQGSGKASGPHQAAAMCLTRSINSSRNMSGLPGMCSEESCPVIHWVLSGEFFLLAWSLCSHS